MSVQDVTSIIQAVATIFVAAALFVSWRCMRIMEAQLTDEQRSRAMQQLYQVINSLLDIRPEIETVLTLRDKPLSEWAVDERKAAHEVCARFHLVGLLVLEGLIPERIFSHAWYFSVPQCHAILQPYLQHVRKVRDPRYWSAFDALVKRVERHTKDFPGFDN